MSKNMNRKILIVMALTGAIGCAPGDKSMRKEHSFTSKAELAKIEAAPAPAIKFSAPPLELEEWALVGPLSTQLGLVPRAPQDEWERIVAAQVAKLDSATFSEAGHCAAREANAFYMAKGVWPQDAVEEFIIARCGSAGTSIGTQAIWWDKKEGSADIELSQVADQLRAQLPQLVDGFKGNASPGEFGLAIAQDSKRLIVSVAKITRNIDVNPVPLRVVDGKLVLEGKVLRGQGDEISAAYTEGDWGAGRCVADGRVALPYFRLTCPLSVADPEARIQISIARKNSVRATSIAQLTLWPGAEPASVWRSAKTRQILKATPPQPGGAPEQILEQINLIRQAAGLAPHTLSAAQTLTAGKLAPHMFAALNAEEPDLELGEKILMGLRAGWDVQGAIIDGSFVTGWLGHSDISLLIASLVESPAGRFALLDKTPGAIAVGAVEQDGRVGAIVNVYNFLPQEDGSRRIARLQQTLDRARKVQGLPQVVRDNNLDAYANDLAARVTAGQLTFEEATNLFMQRCVDKWGQGVSGTSYELQDLATLPLSAALSSGRLNVAIMVTTYKPVNYPWHVYGVAIVFPTSQVAKSVASR